VTSLGLLVALVAMFALWCKPSGSGGGAPNAQPICDAVAPILLRHRDALLPGLPAAERQRVEVGVGPYPVTAPPGTPPFTVQGTGDGGTRDLRIDVGQRDWAFALYGAEYALRGGFDQDAPQLLDVAFWAYLEAALLAPNEAEHLASVGFFLGDRGDYEDARAVLLCGKELAPDSVPIHNNLAFALAGLGDPRGAVSEELAAVSRAPTATFLWNRLAFYYDRAGWSDLGALARAALEAPDGGAPLCVPDDSGSDAGVPACPTLPTPPTSAAALEVYVALATLASDDLLRDLAGVGGAPNVPDTLENVPDLWTTIADLRTRREDCYQQVSEENGDKGDEVRRVLMCERCDRPELASERSLAHQLVAQIIARTRTWANQTLIVIADYLPRGMQLIDARSELTAAERASLGAYWNYQLSMWLDVVKTGLRENDANGRQLTRDYDANLAALDCGRGDLPEWLWNNDEILPFNGKITVWFVVGQISIDIHEGKVVLQLGEGVQFKVGWNWKSQWPILGVGYGLSLDKIIETGAFIGFEPDRGLQGTIELSPAGYPLVLLGADPPEAALFHIGAPMN
jgi:hypothetical protein